MKRRLLRVLGSLFGLLLFGVALWILHRQLRTHSIDDILRSLREIPSRQVLLCLALTCLNYFMMTGYDFLALRYVRQGLAYRKIAMASFISFAFSVNMGLGTVAGGSVRYRLYSAWGISALDITKLVAFCSATLVLGFLALAGVVFLVEPMAVPRALHLPFASVRPIGVIFLLFVAVYLIWSLRTKGPLRIFRWEFALPSPGLLVSQVMLASLEWAVGGCALYALLPVDPDLTLPGFMGIYLLALWVGMASQVPGGLGVFETLIVLLLAPLLPAAESLGPLLVYRAIYYILPLCLAAALLGLQEVLRTRRKK
jgi:uncharacterized membrane protein YbhN (UPF0104 family)